MDYKFYGASVSYEKRINKFREIIEESNKIVFLTGAGISTASGIPDFRSSNGLYNEHDKKYAKYEPEYLLSRDCLLKDTEIFFAYLRDKFALNDYIEPNIAHKSMTALENRGKVSAVITQNIEGLHEAAGSKIVYNCHGSMSECKCDACNKKYPGNYIFANKDPVPKCDCNKPNNYIRPDIVLYGENLPTDAINKSYEAISKADCLVVIGTSLQVQPVASLPNYFVGENMIIINRDETVYDQWADVVFHEDISKVWKDFTDIQKDKNKNDFIR